MPHQFRLCYITDRHSLAPVPLASHLRAIVQAGVDLIQLREKDMSGRDLTALASAATAIARGTHTRIVINDRLDVAIAAEANGVHLGGQSVAPEIVRRHVSIGFLIGVSCHSMEEAIKAEAGGADYILFGPVFDTPSKRQYGAPLGLSKLSEIANRVVIPVLALGGITVDRVRLCIEAGAAGIAGIRLFQECPSVEELVRELRAQFP